MLKRLIRGAEETGGINILVPFEIEEGSNLADAEDRNALDGWSANEENGEEKTALSLGSLITFKD